jgi:integrase
MPSVFPRGGKLWCKVKDGGKWQNKPTPYRVGDEAKTARFAKQTLPKNIDADPEWRAGAVFTRHELQRLISEPCIPEDRRLYHAMMGLGGMRPGEPLRARWRHYDPTLEPLGRFAPAKTKTETLPREVPVHATLAFLLGAWKREGWERTYRRQPTPDDLILPNGRCKRREDKDSQHVHGGPGLGMRRRRRVDLRRSSRTWCSDGRRASNPVARRPSPVAGPLSPVLICGCRLRLPTGNCQFRKKEPSAHNGSAKRHDVERRCAHPRR